MRVYACVGGCVEYLHDLREDSTAEGAANDKACDAWLIRTRDMTYSYA